MLGNVSEEKKACDSIWSKTMYIKRMCPKLVSIKNIQLKARKPHSNQQLSSFLWSVIYASLVMMDATFKRCRSDLTHFSRRFLFIVASAWFSDWVIGTHDIFRGDNNTLFLNPWQCMIELRDTNVHQFQTTIRYEFQFFEVMGMDQGDKAHTKMV